MIFKVDAISEFPKGSIYIQIFSEALCVCTHKILKELSLSTISFARLILRAECVTPDYSQIPISINTFFMVIILQLTLLPCLRVFERWGEDQGMWKGVWVYERSMNDGLNHKALMARAEESRKRKLLLGMLHVHPAHIDPPGLQ